MRQAWEDAFVGGKGPHQPQGNAAYVEGLSPSARAQARIDKAEIIQKKRALDVTALSADQTQAPTTLAVASIEQACMSLASQIFKSISAQLKDIEAGHLGSK